MYQEFKPIAAFLPKLDAMITDLKKFRVEVEPMAFPPPPEWAPDGQMFSIMGKLDVIGDQSSLIMSAFVPVKAPPVTCSYHKVDRDKAVQCQKCRSYFCKDHNFTFCPICSSKRTPRTL